MRAVVTRVARASVRVGEDTTGEIEAGLLVLVGIAVDDEPADADWLAGKLCALRIFRDDAGRMNRSVVEAGGAILLVSQFTLYGDARRGRRPSFIRAAGDTQARSLFDRLSHAVAGYGIPLAFGEFGAEMAVESINAGPVTVLLDSKREF